ncbi:MAG: hypothetical protein QM722_00570 [Piscinibacter sp.]
MSLRPVLAAAGILTLLASPALSQGDACPAVANLQPGNELTVDFRMSGEGQPTSAVQIAVVEATAERRVVEFRLQQPRRTDRLEGRPPASGRGPLFPSRIEIIDRTGARAPVVISAAVSEPTDALAERILTGPTSYRFLMSNMAEPVTIATEPRPSPSIEIGGCTYETQRWQAVMTGSGSRVVQEMVNVPALGISYPATRHSESATGTVTLSYTPLALRIGAPQQLKRDPS